MKFHNAYLGSLNLEHRHSPYIREKFIERDGEPYVIDTFRDLPICLRIPAWAENAELTAPLDYTKD